MNFRTFYINNDHIRYREMLPSASAFEKFYFLENPNQSDIIAIPDGCIDFEFIWENGTCRGYACGSFLQGKRSLISSYSRCFGMRLRANTRFRFMEHDVETIVNHRLPLSDFLDITPLERELNECKDLVEMAEVTQRFFRDVASFTPPAVACSAEQIITSEPCAQRISEVVRSLGYTQQYVNGIFKQNYGVSLKKYSDIVRVQNALRYLEYTSVMDAIAELGYYDQAHFIRDFKQYTSLTPKYFIDIVCNRRQCAVV